MLNTASSKSTSSRYVSAKEKNVKISYPVAIFATDEHAKEGLLDAIDSSRYLSLTGQLSDVKPKTIKKLRFIYPTVILIHFHDVASFDHQVISELSRTWPEAALIVYTPEQHDEMVRQSFQSGAHGYLVQEKPTHQIEGPILDYIQKGIAPVSPRIVSKLIGFLRKPVIAHTGKQKLTEKQKSIAALLVEGQSYDEISAQMGMRLDAVRYHIKQIYTKYNIHKSTQLSKLILG